MDVQKTWEKALTHTEIVRSRVQELSSVADTRVPYVFLSESSVNIGDTVVRKGEVIVQKPAIVLPPNIPQFQGFEFEGDIEDITNFLLVRGVTIPSMKYDNRTHSLDLFEGALSRAVSHYGDYLQRKEDVATGLVIGPDDCWQFSIVIFICSQMVKNAARDLKRLMDEYRKEP